MILAVHYLKRRKTKFMMMTKIILVIVMVMIIKSVKACRKLFNNSKVIHRICFRDVVISERFLK